MNPTSSLWVGFVHWLASREGLQSAGGAGGKDGAGGMLLDLAGRGGSGLAAHAGGVDRLGRDQIQVLVVGDLVEPVAVFQELDVQVLVDLLG